MTTAPAPAPPAGPGARAPTCTASAASSARATCRRRPTPAWSSAPAPPRPRSATGCSSSATTTSATRSSSSPTSPATPSSSPATPPPGPTRRTSSSAACTSWPSPPTSSPSDEQTVILPDLAAGCSMADMAGDRARSRTAGTQLDRRRRRRPDDPGHLHELLRRDQGVHRSARRHDLHVVQRPAPRSSGRSTRSAAWRRRPARCCSCPTSTSAATPPCASSACSLDDCVVWDPHQPERRPDAASSCEDARMILWRGHCSVHGRFSRRGRRGRRAARSPASR